MLPNLHWLNACPGLKVVLYIALLIDDRSRPESIGQPQTTIPCPLNPTESSQCFVSYSRACLPSSCLPITPPCAIFHAVHCVHTFDRDILARSSLHLLLLLHSLNQSLPPTTPPQFALPAISLISSSLLPSCTTLYLIIRGSSPKVLRTACCVFALESNLRMK